MKNIFYFLLGLLLVVLTSATTVSVMTVKPETPKHYIIKSFPNEVGSDDVADFIKSNVTKGWILKSVSAANYGTMNSCWVVVLEKY